MDLLNAQNNLALLISGVLFVVKAFALVDCVGRPPSAFWNTWPKRTWIIVLVLTIVVNAIVWNPLFLLNLVGTVAALVYLAQVRGSH